MGAQKQVVHFQAKKGFSKAQSNEQQRKWTEKAWKKANENGRIDRTRTRLNFEVVRGGKVQAVDQSKSIPELFQENIRARGIKDPNEKCPHDPKYRTVADFIISGSHDTLCRMAFGSQEIDYGKDADNGGVERRPEIEQWAKDMYDVLADRFGEENILSFIVHLDERSPHIHADVIPVKDGRISFKEVFCGSDKYEYAQRTRALHDAFAEVNRKWGLERGDSVNETHRKHQSTEDYRRELSNECSTLERELESKAARLSNLKSQIHIAEIRKKSLTTMVSNLEAARERIEDEIDGIRTSLTDDGMATVQRRALMRKEVSLQKKLEEILWKLADKRGKLDAAEKKLADLKEELSHSEERREELEQEIRSASAKVSELTMNKVGTEALWTVLSDFQQLKLSLPPDTFDGFDDSLLQDMSRRGMKIVTCAALLSLEMVDQATTFAENCGGGGGHSSGDWGRDPQEDDRHWLRRCLERSRQMLAPGGRKIRR